MKGDAERAGLPAGLAANPMLDRWIAVVADGTVTLSPGKVEIGQGILTALAQIAADELDIDVARVRLRAATTATSPNEGVTSGSLSIHDCGRSIRQVAAATRALFLIEAARRLAVDPGELGVRDGTIAGPRNLATSYWELADSVSLARPADPTIPPKAAGQRTLAGTSVPRIDIPGRVFATRPFIHDLKVPGMLYGRVLRPARPGAVLAHLDERSVAATPGLVAIVRDGSFVGVDCETESVAEVVLAKLAAGAQWSGGFDLPDEHELSAWLKTAPAETSVVATTVSANVTPATHTFTREYAKPFLAHAAVGPSCAIATWTGGRLHVTTHSQGVYNLRADLALVFGASPEQIVVEHAEGAGCYGHNGADDVALDAALLARAANGRPVRVQWSRADELTHAPFGAAMTMRLQAELSAAGEVAAWRHEIWSNGHVARPGRAATPVLLAGYELAQPFPRHPSQDPPLAAGGGAQRNAVPIYDFAAQHIVLNRVLAMPLRTSAMRSLGAIGNVFAIESFMDELAVATGQDPLAFRLRHLRDDRARAVLERAAGMAGWGHAPIVEGRGRGIAMARYKNTGAYCAVVAEVDVTVEPRATQLWIAADVGEVVNPDGVSNQIEGGAIQATSWTLKEAVGFSRAEVTSGAWDTYPILRFSEVPHVDVEIIARPDALPLGAGEASQGPTAAAIANAVSAALGVRVRQLPITRERIIAAMD